MIVDILYAILIQPIEWGMGWVFTQSFGFLHSYGLAIILLSLVVNIALIPIYYISDTWQAEERALQDRMRAKLDEIKLAFTGQERFMMTRMLYKLNSYHPLMAVRSSVGLLIQIPFFFAAYQLLDNYDALANVSFLLFDDLSKPDGLLSVGGISINIMPFVMTAINLASAYVYASDLSARDKKQVYIIAGIFLVALYWMPVALVLYWTMNNVFSLAKNLFYKASDRIKSFFDLKVIRFGKEVVFDCCVILLGYLVLSLVISHYLPQGVTKDFFTRSAPYYFIFPAVFAVLVIFRLLSRSKNSFFKQRERLYAYDLTLVVILYIPLVQYILSNLDVVPVSEALTALIFLFVALIIFVVYLPYLLSSLVSKVYSQSLFFLLLLVIVYMPLISSYFGYHVKGSLKTLLLLLPVFILFSYFLVKKNNQRLLVFSIVVLCTNTVFTINTSSTLKHSNASNSPLTLKSKNPVSFVKDSNVYLLVYDAYVANEVMLGYGLDNSSHEEYLINKGFSLYPKTYSIAAQSHTTMGRVLDIKSSEDDLWKNVAGEAYTFEKFKENGYATAGYFPSTYYFQGAEIKYDLFYPAIDRAGSNPLYAIYKSIAAGYFGFDIGFHGFSYEEFLKEKEKVIANQEIKRKFLYSHSSFPNHAPHTGQCRTNEVPLFSERLITANEEMIRDIETIESNDRNAIIIIAGDHGPYLTKNCFNLRDAYSIDEVNRHDLQDRFGAFLAIRLPKNDKIPERNIKVLQDVFPEVLNYLTASDDFSKLKVEPITVQDSASGVYVENGIIRGGVNDGEPLYIGEHQ